MIGNSSTEVIDKVIFCGKNVAFLPDLETYTVGSIFSMMTFGGNASFRDSHSKCSSSARTYSRMFELVSILENMLLENGVLLTSFKWLQGNYSALSRFFVVSQFRAQISGEFAMLLPVV